ncbi:hypothetical protein BJ322DRAFT_1036097 [Thelephora terrestris]|uniref:UBA domain-containing protein n=1 Tax=Thelephora terrestris TaxID=56493 RepID=A0A9P6LB57_9AGAM|nr:hypothetical protein BJ322DRAFT_1036097 [Thelephora terrestris]
MASTTSSSSRNILTNALRGAGLMDRDERMRDIQDKPGGRKGSSKIRAHRQRPVDNYKDQASGPSRVSMLTSRASSSEPLSIRGASRPTAAGRIRRNAVSMNTSKVPGMPATSTTNVGIKVMDQWREFVRSRYNRETKFLNLERMLDDPIVQKHNLLVPGVPGSSGKETAIMFKLAAQLRPAVQTLSLANNHIQSGKDISSIGMFLPKLANLSLANNQLKAMDDIRLLTREKNKLDFLRELVLTGNPIKGDDPANTEQYRRDIVKRFPALEMLDNEPIVKVGFDAPIPHTNSSHRLTPVPTTNSFACPMGASFLTGVSGGVVSDFLTRFFTLFDAQRSELLDVYHPAATFSFSANTSIPPRARIQGLHSTLPNQRNLKWDVWVGGGNGGSRNLTRVGNVDKMAQSLHVGRENVIQSVLGLPQTKHDIAGSPSAFCLDGWLAGSTLFVTVHGQFTEEPVSALRSFDRSFVLAPAADDSRAKMKGWAVEILSDQLTVRGYSSSDAWTPGPMIVQPIVASKGSQPPSLEAALASVPEPQREQVARLCQQTGLNVKFAVDCLQQNGWDHERAIANFAQVKGSLTRDAFL